MKKNDMEQDGYCNYCGKPLDFNPYCGDKHRKRNIERKQHIDEQVKKQLLHR